MVEWYMLHIPNGLDTVGIPNSTVGIAVAVLLIRYMSCEGEDLTIGNRT